MNKIIFELVQARVITWLMGSGHPKGSLEWEMFGAMTGPDADLFRARKLLKALTDSDLLPADPSENLEVRIRVM